MAVDEEFLKPSREYLAHLNGLIASAEAEMIEKIERWGNDDKEYARQQYEDFYRRIYPLRRERDGVCKIMADYYGLQALPPQIITHGEGWTK